MVLSYCLCSVQMPGKWHIISKVLPIILDSMVIMLLKRIFKRAKMRFEERIWSKREPLVFYMFHGCFEPGRKSLVSPFCPSIYIMDALHGQE